MWRYVKDKIYILNNIYEHIRIINLLLKAINLEMVLYKNNSCINSCILKNLESVGAWLTKQKQG